MNELTECFIGIVFEKVFGGRHFFAETDDGAYQFCSKQADDVSIGDVFFVERIKGQYDPNGNYIKRTHFLGKL